MIYFIQSYTSKTPFSEDQELVQNVISKLGRDVCLIPYHGSIPRTLTTKEFLIQAFKSVFKSKKNDLLFGWGSELALFCWLVSKIFFKKRRFLGQNLMINPEDAKNNWKIRFLIYLYKKAFKDSNFRMTVNSEPLIAYYSDIMDCPKEKLSLVVDARSLTPSEESVLKTIDRQCKYVFFGGKMQRDVECFLRVVKRLPNVNFKAVILQSMLPVDYKPLPNLEIYTNVPGPRFFEIMFGASICCIPLKAQTPCGLSVMQKAILMEIAIVSTDTPSMRTIVPNDNCGFLCKQGDDENIAMHITELLSDDSLFKSVCSNAKNNMQNFSPSKVSEQLFHAISKSCY